MVDGAEGDGSLKAVGGTHGVSPYWYYWGPSCVHFYRSGGESRYPGAESRRKPLLLSCASYPSSRTNWRAPGFFSRIPLTPPLWNYRNLSFGRAPTAPEGSELPTGNRSGDSQSATAQILANRQLESYHMYIC